MDHYLKGVGVAVVTPFQGNGVIDFDALESIINHLINGGVNYIVSLGTTGESVTLSKEEKLAIVKHTIAYCNERVPVVVGAGGNHTAEVVKSIEVFNTVDGISAYLSVSPSYNKPSQQGIISHYREVANATERDIILYNVPGRTSKNMEVDTVIQLATEFANIIAIKEAGNNMHQSIALSRKRPKGFMVLSGDDDLVLPQMSAGFDGVISVIANAYPKQFSDMIQMSLLNEYGRAREIFYMLLPMIHLIFEENNPAGIKCVLNEMELCENHFRLPVVPVSPDLDARIREWVSSNPIQN